MIEIYAVTALGPIPLATLGNAEWRGVGQNYLKSLLALGFQQEQSILILYCVLDMADGEIASLTGMSRSAVQRHRTKTLKELRVKLMALMPEGG